MSNQPDLCETCTEHKLFAERISSMKDSIEKIETTTSAIIDKMAEFAVSTEKFKLEVSETLNKHHNTLTEKLEAIVDRVNTTASQNLSVMFDPKDGYLIGEKNGVIPAIDKKITALNVKMILLSIAVVILALVVADMKGGIVSKIIFKIIG